MRPGRKGFDLRKELHLDPSKMFFSFWQIRPGAMRKIVKPRVNRQAKFSAEAGTRSEAGYPTDDEENWRSINAEKSGACDVRMLRMLEFCELGVQDQTRRPGLTEGEQGQSQQAGSKEH